MSERLPDDQQRLVVDSLLGPEPTGEVEGGVGAVDHLVGDLAAALGVFRKPSVDQAAGVVDLGAVAREQPIKRQT